MKDPTPMPDTPTAELADELRENVALAIAETFLCQPCEMPWEDRADQLADAAIAAWNRRAPAAAQPQTKDQDCLCGAEPFKDANPSRSGHASWCPAAAQEQTVGDVEAKARELLVGEYRSLNYLDTADALEQGKEAPIHHAALRAITAALTASSGVAAGSYHWNDDLVREIASRGDCAYTVRIAIANALNKVTASSGVAIAEGWRDIETAPRDGSVILGLMRADLPKSEGAWDQSRWASRYVPMRHEGKTPSDYDLGWSVALPVGHGGLPDHWFVGWQPLPPPPSTGEAS